MAELTVQDIVQSGKAVTLTSAGATGDSFLNNERTFVHVENSDVTNTKTISVARALTSIHVDRSGDVPVANLSVAVPPSGKIEFVVPVGVYGARPVMTYDSSSGLTIAARRIPII